MVEDVALYARVSTVSQVRDNSIASQVAALRERITANGFQLVPDHACVDDSRSGASLVRPAAERHDVVEATKAARELSLVISHREVSVAEVAAGLDYLDGHGQREVIRTLIRQIEVDGDRSAWQHRTDGGRADIRSDDELAPPRTRLRAAPRCLRSHAPRRHG